MIPAEKEERKKCENSEKREIKRSYEKPTFMAFNKDLRDGEKKHFVAQKAIAIKNNQ